MARTRQTSSGVPWHTSVEDPDADGPPARVTLGARMTEHGAQELQEMCREAAQRRLQIMKQDLEKFGYTAGCPGCRALLTRQ